LLFIGAIKFICFRTGTEEPEFKEWFPTALNVTLVKLVLKNNVVSDKAGAKITLPYNPAKLKTPALELIGNTVEWANFKL